MTVREEILAHLQTGGDLTPLSALNLFRCLSLSQRIGELKRMGHPIESELVRHDNGKCHARYWLPQSRGQLSLFGGSRIERSGDGVGHRATGSY